MNVADIIARKRDGRSLTSGEIAELVRGYTRGDVADYQMSAFAMASCLRGMDLDETAALTREMLHSGQTLAGDSARRVDKHSTGGIGDKSSLIIAPLLACCGLQVPMISGRALGATGGTLDKLESIAGFRADLSLDEINAIVDRVGCVITGTTPQLVPADRRLYALRDVTATIDSIPLITASILSKKLAANLSALVLDVKFGSGAFMKTRQRARALADWLVAVGASMGLATHALLSVMDQPNGRMVGNSVEVDEALETLGGQGPADLRELTLALAGEVLLMKGLAKSEAEARATLLAHLGSGRAKEKFREMVAAQGGDLDAPRPRAAEWVLPAAAEGFVQSIDGASLGLAIVEMGGGRKTAGEVIDHAVGVEMLVRLGDRVAKGQGLVKVLATEAARLRGLPYLEGAIQVGPQPPAMQPLVADKIVAAQRPLAAIAAGERLAGPVGEAAGPAAIDPQQRRQLVEAALGARAGAYAPYSHFRVGAAVLTASGQIYAGANIENASYGLTQCAERVAIASAVADGQRQLVALAVAAAGGATPCGACRQVAAEFCADLPILLVDAGEPSCVVETTLGDLLPCRFDLQRAPSDQDASDAGGHETGQRAS